MARVPAPELYETWEEWATAVRDFLDQHLRTEFNPVVFVPSYTVATVPKASRPFGIIGIVDEVLGEYVLAYSDGYDWRRCTDGVVIS